MELLRVIKRIWRQIAVIMLVLAALCLFYIKEDNDIKVYGYYQDIIDGYRAQLAVKPEDEAYTYIDKYTRKNLIDHKDREYIEKALVMFNDNIAYTDNFSKDIENKMSNAEGVLSSSLYAGKYNFGRLNTIKGLYDMETVKDMEVSLSNTTAIEKLMEFKELPLLCVLMILVLVMAFIEERSNGMWDMVHAGANGRFRLAVKRCFIILLTSVFVSFLVNSIVYGIYLTVYGGSADLGNAIQSSGMFNMFMLPVSILQFFVLYCLSSAMGLFCIGLLMLLIMMRINSNKVAILIMVGVYAAEFILYNSITSDSAVSFLKYINIYNVIMVSRSVMVYENWGFDGFITDAATSTMIMAGLLILVCIAAVIYVNVRGKRRKNRILSKIYDTVSMNFQRIFAKVPSFGMEIHKTHISQNGLIIFLAAVYLIAGCKIYRGVDYSGDNVYIDNFYEQFGGYVPNEEIEAYVSVERKNMERLKKDSEGYSYDLQQLESSIKTMESDIAYAKKVNDERRINAVIMNPKTYNDVFGERLYANQENINLICLFAIILTAAGTFSYERKCGMYQLGRTCSNRKKVWLNKACTILLTTFIIWLVSMVLNWVNIADVYDFNQLSAPIQSLMQFEKFPFEISIGAYIVFCQIFRLVLMTSISFVVLSLSIYLKYIMAIVVSVLLLIPYILYLFDIKIMYYTAIVPAMDFNRYWCDFGTKLYGYTMPVIIIVSGIAMGYMCYKKFTAVTK